MAENENKELEIEGQENEEELDEQSSDFQPDDEQQSIDRVESLLKGQGKEDEQSDKTEEVVKPEKVKEELTPEIPLIDEALASKYPVLKPYLNQPQSIIPDLYAKLQREYTKSKQTKPQLEIEVKKEPESGEMPDPVDDPKAFKEWLKQARERDKQEAKDEVLKEMESRLTPFQEQVVQKTQEDVRGAIAGGLTEFGDIDPQEAMDLWQKENASDVFNEDGEINLEFTSIYDRNPKKFVKEVINAYKLHKLTSEKSKTAEEIEADRKKVEAEAKIKAAKIVSDNIKKQNSIKAKDIIRDSRPHDDKIELTESEELLAKVQILTEQENNV